MSVNNIMVNFELDLFIKNLYYEIQALVYSDELGDSKENKFTEYVMETLADAGETEGIRLCNYVKENKNENIQFKVNGYALEEGYENVDIFISSYRDTNEQYRLSKVDFDKLIKWSTDFINAALKGMLDEIEPSSEAYGLASILQKQRKNIIRINIFILSNGDIPHEPPLDFKLKNIDNILFNFNIWDIERLHRLSESTGNREPIEIDFEELMGETIPCLEMPSKTELYECYLAIVSGEILATLYKNYGIRLLESNVRAFLQQTGKVNKGIRDTILGKPHMFLPYNNGLATTAQEIQTKIDTNGQKVITSIKDFQIVNGGQTIASIFHTARNNKNADISSVFVQMKVTVIKNEKIKDKVVPDISRYANSQNKVSELDLSSNNSFLQRLEELSRTTYAIDFDDSNKQTIWFFERVKGQYKEALNKEPTQGKQKAFKLKYPKQQLIAKSEVAKYMNIWYLQPFNVAKGAQKNYIGFLKEVEKKFKKEKPSKVYWEDLVANGILFKSTDKLFGRKGYNPIGDTNVKSHTVAYALSYFFEITKNRFNLGAIWQKQKIEEDLLIELKKLLVYTYTYFKSLDVALISEEAKKEKTWKSLKAKVDHPMNMEIVNKYLMSDSAYKERYETKTDDIERDKFTNTLEKITSLGLKFWDGLETYMSNVDCLSENKKTFVYRLRKKLGNRGDLTDIEIKKGGEIVDSILNQNIVIEDVISLSKLIEGDLIDPSIIYNRIKKISKNNWKKIIDIGEQTGRLNFNELSVIKTVITKLKKKESIDLKRLQIVEKSLDKVKKLGVKV